VNDFDPASITRLTLITRVNCGLCDEAQRDLDRLGGKFDLLDVDEDPELLRRYNEHVPVLLMDGQELARAPLTEQTLRLAVDLSRAEL
jgi:glutaredoxin